MRAPAAAPVAAHVRRQPLAADVARVTFERALLGYVGVLCCVPVGRFSPKFSPFVPPLSLSFPRLTKVWETVKFFCVGMAWGSNASGLISLSLSQTHTVSHSLSNLLTLTPIPLPLFLHSLFLSLYLMLSLSCLPSLLFSFPSFSLTHCPYLVRLPSVPPSH